MTNTPDPIDVHVGARLKARRSLVGMSQATLGDALGVTFQQVQKYEKGANRMGSSKLYRVASVLDVPVSYFFDDLPGDAASPRASMAASNDEMTDDSNLVKRETLELVRSYYKITDRGARKGVYQLIRAMGRG